MDHDLNWYYELAVKVSDQLWSSEDLHLNETEIRAIRDAIYRAAADCAYRQQPHRKGKAA